MKLIIQIPCYNEAKTLKTTLDELPRHVHGVETVEWLIVDDGSVDDTAQVAKACGVDHIIVHTQNQGLAQAFMTGITASLSLGADIIVNTDADNQYAASSIPDLIQPVLDGKAEIVIGARPIQNTPHFSPAKKLLQNLGSGFVRLVSGTTIPDAPSGFRAMSREAAMRLNVFSEYTYTLETILQAGLKNIPITWVPIATNADLRPSRLVKSISSYIRRSIMTILRIFVVYKPFRFFATVGSVLMALGLLIGGRFLWFFILGNGSGHIQSLILASIFIGMGFQTITLAFIADLLSVNRKLLEELTYKARKQ